VAAAKVSTFGAREPKLLTIGQVLNLLRGEFSDLSNSKLRFLEDQGLVTPQRTDAGYRKFSQKDVDRLRLALQLQRDRYLPLKVIKDYFDDLDAGRQPNLPSMPDAKPVRSRVKKLTALDLVSQSGISDALISAAQDAKLIGQAPFGASDVEIAKALVELNKFGLAPRHLNALRVEAEREIGIIEGVIKPVLSGKDTSSRAKAEYLARQLQALFNIIRDEIIERVVGQIDSTPEA
jgi:DNA-binding transcriptional MerR regulator